MVLKQFKKLLPVCGTWNIENVPNEFMDFKSKEISRQDIEITNWLLIVLIMYGKKELNLKHKLKEIQGIHEFLCWKIKSFL